jgi:hypothetical protein
LTVDGATVAEAAPAADLNLTGDWTVELWFRDEDPNGFDHPFAYLLDKGDGVAAEAPYYVLLGNGSLLVGLRSAGVNHPLTYNLHAVGYSPKIWQHMSATFQSSTTTLTLYLNGVRVAAQRMNARSTGNNLPLELGRQGPLAGKYFFGKLDDVRIWNRARTAYEIQSTYHQQLDGPQSGLVANWKFDGDCASFVLDSLSSHPLSLVAAAGWSADVPTSPDPSAGAAHARCT